MSGVPMRPMMELLTLLRAGGATLSVVDGSLKCSAPKGLLTPQLREELTSQKPEIIAFLQASQRASRETAQETAIPRVDRSGVLPLSYAQQRLWFLGQLDPESVAYNIGAVLQVSGELNVPLLGRSLKAIVRRHEGLRTCFRQSDGAPVRCDRKV